MTFLLQISLLLTCLLRASPIVAFTNVAIPTHTLVFSIQVTQKLENKVKSNALNTQITLARFTDDGLIIANSQRFVSNITTDYEVLENIGECALQIGENGVSEIATVLVVRKNGEYYLGKVVNGVGNVYNNFSKAVGFGGDILKKTGEKLNILGRAYPENGSIGTKKLFDELISKGVPETELTGLFKQMPKGVDEFGFDWDALLIVDQNTKYWNDFNKVHIDNVIANNGPIRFIHDPRLIENQYNVISQTAMDKFSVLARSQNIKKLPTFLKWEYDYLLSKGYKLSENGLMIK